LAFTPYSESTALTFFSSCWSGTAVDTRGTVSVEYAVVIGTLAAAISMAFTGLGGRLVEKLANLPI
jgi:Flp pilus assembly pilin Flp